mmetsp:Transcript_9418/g.14490  ORF Transcript_9418/g.14490 Transcript_9418/m.14490 type:complete len:173 (+) Transcript_9418:1103-1621(+)
MLDLKPDNFAIDDHGQFKLLDFGLAVCCQVDDFPSTQAGDYETYKLTGETGSIRYMACEVAKREERYGTRVDVYSFGLACWEILALRGKPFAFLSVEEHSKQVIHGKLRPTIPSAWNTQLATIIKACWNGDQNKRPDMPQVLEVLKQVQREYDNGLDPLGLTVGTAPGARCC